MSDATRLRRVVAFFQRQLGDVFGNAQARRRNHRFELDVAVYEKPLPSGNAYKMSEKQIRSWIKLAADKAHPRLYKRVRVDIEPWRVGRASKKLFAPVRIVVDAAGAQAPAAEYQANEPVAA
jgi:hypothetical protein